MEPIDSKILRALGEMALPDGRTTATATMARVLGGRSLILFAGDPELDVVLPAPGLPQTLRRAQDWRNFLAECVQNGDHAGMVADQDGKRAHAVGYASPDGAVAVLIGEGTSAQNLAPLRPVLPLLGALFRSERLVAVSEVRARSSSESAERANRLAAALQDLRVKLDEALADVGASRAEARQRAEQAEALAEELQAQAIQLEEQTTELEILNEELLLRSQDAESAKLAADAANRAKSEFLANMSHELRTPINAVIGYTELLDMGLTGPVTTDQRGQLERIRASSAHLLTLVNDVLDLAKVEAGRMTVASESESAREVIEEALALVEMQAEEQEISLHGPTIDRAVTYVGDRDRVRQVLANLLTNAVKFTRPGGSVSVSCVVTADRDPSTDMSGDGPWLCITVEDTGIGLSQEEVQRVFQPFIQAQSGRTRSHGGTGLGLTISRQLARLMGGDLTAISEPGVGSRFILWLPSRQSSAGALDSSIRLGAGGGPDGWPVGLTEVGQALQTNLPAIISSFAHRLRAEAIGSGADLNDSEIIDHVPTLTADIARLIMKLGRTGGDPAALRDNADVQRIIAERHGADRAQRGWTSDDLRREFEILREELVNTLGSKIGPGEVDIAGALELLYQLLDWARRASLRSHHAAVVGDTSNLES
ncbi:MAG TPA: ATP-binding protein [Longimicrobiaceae bacterium]|nr:ATP-binding protein [Longimicrobiaceae bacterium]